VEIDWVVVVVVLAVLCLCVAFLGMRRARRRMSSHPEDTLDWIRRTHKTWERNVHEKDTRGFLNLRRKRKDSLEVDETLVKLMRKTDGSQETPPEDK
jgi:hypothetical protein